MRLWTQMLAKTGYNVPAKDRQRSLAGEHDRHHRYDSGWSIAC